MLSQKRNPTKTQRTQRIFIHWLLRLFDLSDFEGNTKNLNFETASPFFLAKPYLPKNPLIINPKKCYFLPYLNFCIFALYKVLWNLQKILSQQQLKQSGISIG